MLFALLCDDKPGKLETRLETRPAHVDYLQRLGARLKFAGPFLGQDEKPNGTMLVVEADSEDAARAIADADPYAKGGLFESVRVRRWDWRINNPDNR